jgi:protoheme IX farnesyltransferase
MILCAQGLFLPTNPNNSVFGVLPLPVFAIPSVTLIRPRLALHDPGHKKRNLGSCQATLGSVGTNSSFAAGAISSSGRTTPQNQGKTGKMATTNVMPNPTSSQTLKSRLRDYYTLTKPEVNLLILMTTSAGYALASRSPFRALGLVNTLVGTLLVASGTATLNQWMERVWDGRMRRTASRPVPSGRMHAHEAFTFGLLLSIVGGVYLAVAVNLVAAALAMATLLSYLLIYTPLKRRTPLCTLLGAFPGAMPTLIGWAGASGRIDPQAWFLFAILFLWQFPHFLAIALMYREDYARAGYKMLPAFDREARFTRAEILGLSLLLVVTTLLPSARLGLFYGLAMLLAGAFLLYYVAKLTRSASIVLASKLVHASVIYLPVVLVALVVAFKA